MNYAKENDPIVVDCVLGTEPTGETSATVPQSVLDNSILLNKELSIHPVDQLAYTMDQRKLAEIVGEHNFDQINFDILKELIEINSGYISDALIRAHIGIAMGACTRIAEMLYAENIAVQAPQSRPLYILPPDKRLGWLQPSSD